MASEVSDSENKNDQAVLKVGFRSIYQSAMRKKILAINQQAEAWEDDGFGQGDTEQISFFVPNGSQTLTQQIATSLMENKKANLTDVKEFSVQAK